VASRTDRAQAKEIGRRLAEARRAARLTQGVVADAIGVSIRSYQGYEGGEVIPYGHFPWLSDVLQRSMGWFLHGDDVPSSTELVRIADSLSRVVEELRLIRAQLERNAMRQRGVSHPGLEETRL
jgi:transcriptional regulator with XRE-family HTH domain